MAQPAQQWYTTVISSLTPTFMYPVDIQEWPSSQLCRLREWINYEISEDWCYCTHYLSFSAYSNTTQQYSCLSNTGHFSTNTGFGSSQRSIYSVVKAFLLNGKCQQRFRIQHTGSNMDLRENICTPPLLYKVSLQQWMLVTLLSTD